MVNSSKQHLADLAHVAPLVLAKEQLIAVPPPFQDLLPAVGLQRGWATSVVGSPAGRVFAWALLSELTRSGGWIATVDVSGINLTAANEVGLSIERVLVVSGTDAQNWAPTMGALVGAVDVIVYGAPRHRIQPSTFRKLMSRCRERGTVLMQLPDRRHATKGGLPVEADVSFDVCPVGWSGLGDGHGRLASRAINVTASGRRIPGQPRKGTFMVPDACGTVRPISAPPTPTVPLSAALTSTERDPGLSIVR